MTSHRIVKILAKPETFTSDIRKYIRDVHLGRRFAVLIEENNEVGVIRFRHAQTGRMLKPKLTLNRSDYT